MIVLKQICRDINMEPRKAREILRQLSDQGIIEHAFKGRWKWENEEVDKIKGLLLNASSTNNNPN